MCGRFSSLTLEDVQDVLDQIQADLEAVDDAWRVPLERLVSVEKRPGDTVVALRAVEPSAPSGGEALRVGGPGVPSGGKSLQDGGASAPLLLSPATFSWGFDFSWSDRPIINTRIEKAQGSAGVWPEIAAAGRCIIPVMAFHERNSRGALFEGGQPRGCYFCTPGSLMMLAGVFAHDRVSVVTRPPNEVVGAVHDRMPVILRPSQVQSWLGRNWQSGVFGPQMALAYQPLWEKPVQMQLF